MTAPSTESSTPVDYLLAEIARLKRDRTRLQGRISHLRKSRDFWKDRATHKPSPLAKDDPRHGTTNGYSNLGCRCRRCRDAWTAYCVKRTHERGTRRPYAVYLADVRSKPPPPHGTESRYTNRKCRCDECKRAAREARNQRRYRDPETTELTRAYDRQRRRKTAA